MTGDYTVKVGRRQEIAARILCAVAAVIVWLYVMSIDRPDFEKTFTGVEGKIKSIRWTDNGEALAFTQEGGRVTVNCTGYPYGKNLVVRTAEAELE